MSYAVNQLNGAKRFLLRGESAAALDAACRGISNLTDKDVPTVAAQYSDAQDAIDALDALLSAGAEG